MDACEKRVVLRRSQEARTLRAFGIAIYLGILFLLVASLVWSWEDYEWSIMFATLLLFFSRGFFISTRQLLRRVTLHESYISFGYWSFTPRIYSYVQIASVETVEVSESHSWRRLEPETYVKVIFDDGQVLKVQKSLMSVREFRKHLTKRAGRKFRKPSKNNRA